MGGAINLVTKKPSKELEGEIGYGFEAGKSSKTVGNNIPKKSSVTTIVGGDLCVRFGRHRK